MGNYNWKELNERYEKAVGPESPALAVKYMKDADEVLKIPEIQNFGEKGGVCQTFQKAVDEHMTVYYDASNNAFDYCSICNGILPVDERWENGEDMMLPPTKWFNTKEGAKAHADYEKKGVPEGGDNILVLSPLDTGNIEEPDVILLALKPRAAFIILAGLQNRDFQELTFPFVGESNCTDAWGYTYNTGKPGISLGCKGERLVGGLKENEIRISLTPEQFAAALDGFDALQANGINYPSYIPEGMM